MEYSFSKNTESFSEAIVVLRVFAIFGVVLIHIIWGAISDISQPGIWWTVSLLDALTRTAVPIFVIISGALLLHPAKEESLGSFFIKRFSRVGVPLVGWSVIYIVWTMYWEPSVPLSLQLKKTVVFGLPFFHLYFLFLISGLYLITPILRTFIHRLEPSLKVYFLVLTFGIASITSFFDLWYRDYWLFGSVVSVTFFLPYLGYYVAGAYLRDIRVPAKYLKWIGIGFLVSSWTIAGGTWVLMHRHGFSAKGIVLQDYLSLPMIGASLCLYVWIQGKTAKTVRNLSRLPWIQAIDRAAFGIYLIHPLVLQLITPPLRAAIPHTLSFYGLTFVLSTCLAFGAALILLKIPGLRWLVGAGRLRYFLINQGILYSKIGPDETPRPAIVSNHT